MLTFASGWDEFKRRYAENQAFLDSFSEGNVGYAVATFEPGSVGGNLSVEDLEALKGDINSDDVTVTVEQGPHQPEDFDDGQGFALHITVRASRIACHFYIQQQNDGSLYVIDITA